MADEYSAWVLAAYVIIFLTGLPANLLALRAFVGRLRQPGPAPVHVLLLSLTLADLLLLLLLPLKIVEAAWGFSWPLPRWLCVPTTFAHYSSIYCSTGLLAAISVERYLGVAFPVRYKLARRPLHGLLAALLACTLACGHCTIVIVIEYVNATQLAPAGRSCYGDFTGAQLAVLLPVRLELSLVLFLLPLVITVFCYWRLVRLVWGQAHAGPRRRRAAGLALVNLLSFLLCFGPYNVSHAVGFYLQTNPPWRVDALIFTALNASLDPLLFYFSSSTVRRAFWRGVKGFRRQGASLWGCRAKERVEATSESPGPAQAKVMPGSDSTPG